MVIAPGARWRDAALMRWLTPLAGAVLVAVSAGSAVAEDAPQPEPQPEAEPPAEGSGAEALAAPTPAPPADAVPPPPPGYGEQVPATAAQPPPAPGAGYAAQTPAGAPDPYRHGHDGFFLRLSIGPGHLSTSADASMDLSVSGGGIGLSVAIGGAIARNLVLYGDLYGTGAPRPNVRIGDDEAGASEDVSLSFGGLGIGVAYFLMPANVYLSASLGLVTASLESDAETFTDEVKAGPGVNVMIGKEFWVGDELGIGFAGQLQLGSSSGSVIFDPGTSEEVTLGTFGAGVHFSATYN